MPAENNFTPCCGKSYRCNHIGACVHRREWAQGFGPNATKPTNPKDAIGDRKLPLHLWPTTATAMGCMAFLEGAQKYGRQNWRVAGVRASVYVAALQRHMNAWFEGQDIDPESGLPHLGKALACIAILVDAQAAGKLTDDRSYPGGYLELADQMNKLIEHVKAAKPDVEPEHFTLEGFGRIGTITANKGITSDYWDTGR